MQLALVEVGVTKWNNYIAQAICFYYSKRCVSAALTADTRE